MLAAGFEYDVFPSDYLYRLYRSVDGGTNWTIVDALQMRVAALCCSGDGKTIFAGAKPGSLYRSTDAGLTWAPTTAPSKGWHTLCCSVDGNRVFAAPNLGPGFQLDANVLYTSTDSGANWKSNAVPVYGVARLACSADGRRVVLVATGIMGGRILTSTDEGATWTEQAVPTFGDPFNAAAASSADGHSVVAASASWIYTLRTAPAPTLDIRRITEGLSLSWTVPSSAFVPQENSQPGATGWTDVATQPELDSATARFNVSVPREKGSKFYRLMMR
jgi:hypothetical protein